MTAILCDAKDCNDTRGHSLAHPLGGEVKLCPAHYAQVKQAQDAVIFRLLRVN